MAPGKVFGNIVPGKTVPVKISRDVVERESLPPHR